MPKKPFTRTANGRAGADELVRRGLVLHQSGKARDAEGHYRQALGAQPRHPAANHLLGLLMLQRGEPAAAVELIRKAVEVRGSDPQYHCNLGVALNAAGEADKAVASFDRAIALQPDFAEAHSNRGMALKNLDRFREAEASYRRAIELKPREAGFHLNLANTLSEVGDLHEAEASYRRALELRPGYPAALSGLCMVLEGLGRAGEAVAAGEAAVAARPDGAEYWRALGRAYRAAGQLDQAVTAYRRAIALEPGAGEPWRLMSLAIRRSSYDDDMAQMERLHADGGTSEEQRMHLGFAIAKGFQDFGDAERAFSSFVDANRLKRGMVRFSLENLRHEFESLRRVFAAPPVAVPEVGAGGPAPIFIVGLPRSGKSTLEAMLGRHPKAAAMGELSLLPALVHEFSIRHRLAAPDADLAALPPSAFAELGAEYLGRARHLAGNDSTTIDTMPPNFRHVGFIRLALPGARILHAVRDPLEHCVALFQKYFGRPGYEYTYDPAELLSAYREYRSLIEQWRRIFPGVLLDVDLASLLAEPAVGMRQVLEFCRLSFDPACAVPHVSEPELGGDEPSSADRRLAMLAPYEPLFGQARNISRRAAPPASNPLAPRR